MQEIIFKSMYGGYIMLIGITAFLMFTYGETRFKSSKDNKRSLYRIISFIILCIAIGNYTNLKVYNFNNMNNIGRYSLLDVEDTIDGYIVQLEDINGNKHLTKIENSNVRIIDSDLNTVDVYSIEDVKLYHIPFKDYIIETTQMYIIYTDLLK